MQTYAPLIADTHSNKGSLFHEGTAVSVRFVDFVTDPDLSGGNVELAAGIQNLVRVTITRK